MKRIAVDMDGVLANVYSQFIKMHEADFNIRLTDADVDGIPEAKVFPNERTYVNAKGFFRNAPLIADCQRILEAINNKYDLFIVSAAMEFPNSLTEKQAWLNEHFPFISWRQMVFCGSKAIIKADIMIDDYFRNLDSFSGDTTILFTQPHNKFADPGRHKRVHTWLEIEQLLLS